MKCEICGKETPYLIKKDMWVLNGDDNANVWVHAARCKDHLLVD